MKFFTQSSSMGRIAVAATLLGGNAVNAISIDLTNSDAVKEAAGQIAYNMLTYYTGNHTGDVAGNLPAPYYWWEAGAMFGSLVDYYYYTGDDTYNDLTMQALQHQVGDDSNFMPENQTKTLGNDDQSFWGMAAMSAAEQLFPNPPSDEPQWLALAQGVFNSQITRWDDSTCGGGLRWQIFAFNAGYTYKNTISNGCFFNIASRLAVYTGNQTYADWADKMFTWVETLGLMSPTYAFYDGSSDVTNCSSFDHVQWTYNTGVFLLGAAHMYNFTDGDAIWKTRIEGMLTNGASVFFANGTMYESACEPEGTCNTDQKSFKAYLSRWMAATIKLAPFTYDIIFPMLQTSATAALAQCNAGSAGYICGVKWTTGTYDGDTGVGQQMSALQVVQSMLIAQSAAPVTNDTGGTSVGDPNAGTSSSSTSSTGSIAGASSSPISTGDRVGAGFLTTLVLVAVLGGAFWMVL